MHHPIAIFSLSFSLLLQVVSMQKEMQKQMASDRSMEKDNSDASEKFLLQQTFKNFLNEDLPAIIEKTLKRELATFGQTVEERFQVKISVCLLLFCPTIYWK